MSHDLALFLAKTFGLFYLMGFFLCVVAYAFWPSNRKRFDRAKTSILDREDKPWK